MKVQFVVAAAVAMLTLTACGGSHEKVHAVDKLAEAEATAIEKAPKAEEVKFDDHGQPPFAAVDAPAATDATKDATATDATKDANAEAKQPVVEEKAEAAPAEQPAEEQPAQAPATESK